MPIQKGSRVKFEYVLTVEENVVDSSEENGPLEYTHGSGEIIEGLAKELEGLSAGDKKEVEVLPADAYGEVDPDAFREVPKSQLPQNIEPKVGMMLQVMAPGGKSMPVAIAKVTDKAVVIDFNHPLAGKKLNFSVKIVSVE